MLSSLLAHKTPLRTRVITQLLNYRMASKSIAVLDAAELKDGQMKEVAFEDGKVLLSKLGSKIHATSAFCTHYGVSCSFISMRCPSLIVSFQAPLAKGVLTNDGRVVW